MKRELQSGKMTIGVARFISRTLKVPFAATEEQRREILSARRAQVSVVRFPLSDFPQRAPFRGYRVLRAA